MLDSRQPPAPLSSHITPTRALLVMAALSALVAPRLQGETPMVVGTVDNGSIVLELAAAAPRNVVVVVDTSSSMGAELPAIRSALRDLPTLRDDESVKLVVFDTIAETVDLDHELVAGRATHLLPALEEAVSHAPDRILVLTDGRVGALDRTELSMTADRLEASGVDVQLLALDDPSETSRRTLDALASHGVDVLYGDDARIDDWLHLRAGGGVVRIPIADGSIVEFEVPDLTVAQSLTVDLYQPHQGVVELEVGGVTHKGRIRGR